MPRSAPRLAAIALLAGLLAPACNELFAIDELRYDGRSAGGGAPDACDPPVPSGCAAMTEALCAYRAACIPFPMGSWFNSLDECVADLGRECARSAAAPGSGMTEGRLLTCAEAVAGAACSAVWGQIPGCEFPGDVGLFGACRFDVQCAEEAYCAKPSVTSCGTCTLCPGAGEPCDDNCQLELTCHQGVCVARGALGEPCDDAHPCAVELACFQAQCTEPLPLGSICDDTTPSCDLVAGLYCSPTEQQCVAVAVGVAGSPVPWATSARAATASQETAWPSPTSASPAIPWQGPGAALCAAVSTGSARCRIPTRPVLDRRALPRDRR